jgi:hypothetical protein
MTKCEITSLSISNPTFSVEINTRSHGCIKSNEPAGIELDSKGKLTQQEQQRWIDKNLCLFCGGSGH